MKRGVVASARDIAPIRELNRHEAFALAERQARCVLELVGATGPAVPEQVIADLPHIGVRYITPFPVSGATHWLPGRWSIVINAGEPITRQRFSLAHEFKHILDNPFIDVLYGTADTPARAKLIEQLCDYFAGCLLVPEPWLRDAWTSGTHELPVLAGLFNVSQAAIATRLGQTGITRADFRRRPPGPGLGFEPSAVLRRTRRPAQRHERIHSS